MGASHWDYYVPYREDLEAALQELRHKVFQAEDYFWDPWDDDAAERVAKPRPATIDELWEDGDVQEEGTHSILDMHRVVQPGEEPDYFTVQPVTAAEALRAAGTDRLTRAHVEALQPLAAQRWFGRCAVLHTPAGEPEEIYFWGFSGD
ncbi:hypothetical protein [Peterkaempfera griseoplana]|uniref:hypothetical protein n=1 Tax=Peterkaempfera griseoplana TaxID=66896 RepID=UPI0006E3B0B7|nr:hypothetical protein [Peterkaempfera griseoplana]